MVLSSCFASHGAGHGSSPRQKEAIFKKMVGAGWDMGHDRTLQKRYGLMVIYGNIWQYNISGKNIKKCDMSLSESGECPLKFSL